MSAYRKVNNEMIPVTTEGHPQYYFDTLAQAEAALPQLEEGADVFVEEGSVSDFKPIAFSGKASDVSYDNTSSGLDATNVQSAIDKMKSTFQAGVDAIFNAIKNAGVTPSSSTPTDCATAIGNLRKTPYTGTYTYPSGSTGGTVDLGAPHDKRYVNAGNVYSKGVTDADARANPSSTNYITGYNKGVTDADARANPSSTNYITGYNNGVNAQKAVVWNATTVIYFRDDYNNKPIDGRCVIPLANVKHIAVTGHVGDTSNIKWAMSNLHTDIVSLTNSLDTLWRSPIAAKFLHIGFERARVDINVEIQLGMTCQADQLR